LITEQRKLHLKKKEDEPEPIKESHDKPLFRLKIPVRVKLSPHCIVGING